MRSFEEMWSYSSNILGSFTDKEARKMYDLLCELKDESIVVEIGSYYGRSSSLIGQVAQDKGFEFTTIDSFITDRVGEETFKRNMNKDFIRYQHLTMNSRRPVNLFKDKEIDLIFIDGDHRQEGVLEDINCWLPKAKNLVLFHDYNSSWDGVKLAVDALLFDIPVEVVDSLGVIRL